MATKKIGARYRHVTSSITGNEIDDEAPMTNEIQMTNNEKAQLECCTPFIFALNRSRGVRDSCFVIHSPFAIRHSSFSS
jgi:hypothetical protein